MKPYLFTTLSLIASVVLALSKYRGNPGIVAELIGGAIILTSYISTYIGVKNAVDNLWIRMAISILAPAIIGLATA